MSVKSKKDPVSVANDNLPSNTDSKKTNDKDLDAMVDGAAKSISSMDPNFNEELPDVAHDDFTFDFETDKHIEQLHQQQQNKSSQPEIEDDQINDDTPMVLLSEKQENKILSSIKNCWTFQRLPCSQDHQKKEFLKSKWMRAFANEYRMDNVEDRPWRKDRFGSFRVPESDPHSAIIQNNMDNNDPDNILRKIGPKYIVWDNSSHKVTMDDLCCLKYDAWLNDVIISAAMSHFYVEASKLELTSNVMIFTPLLCNYFVEYPDGDMWNDRVGVYRPSRGEKTIFRMFKEKSAIEYDTLIFVCNINNLHWNVMIFYNK